MFYLREYEHVSDPKFIANLFMQGWGEERTIPHPNIYYRTKMGEERIFPHPNIYYRT